VLGGWLTELFNWRAGYWFLFGFGALTTLALLAWFGETLPASAPAAAAGGAPIAMCSATRAFRATCSV
jgi:predicted MFS family arabinose efflux permease